MIYPTARGVLLMAAGAPLALLIGVFVPAFWYAGMAWIPAVLALLLLDWAVAPPAPKFAVDVPGVVEVGQPLVVAAEIEVKREAPRGLELAFSTGPKLRAAVDNRMTVDRGELRPAMAFTAIRRGTDAVERLWARWPGPMGLVWRMRYYPVDREVIISPSIRQVRDDAQLLLRDAHMGERSRIDRGEGSEFEALAEWQSGMERRDIDWRQSARHMKLLAREHRIERNNQIVFAVDAGRVMCEPVAGLPRVDRAISAALLSAYTALKLGDRVSFFGFDSRPRISSGSVSGVRAFSQVQRFAAKLDYSTAETNYTLALATLAGSLHRRSLVIVFTEFTDQTGAELMLRAAANMLSRHLLLFVVLADDELEELAAAEPKTVDDVSRAVTAAALLRERRLVISRLRHIGIQVIEARHDAVGPTLVRHYLDLKRRNML